MSFMTGWLLGICPYKTVKSRGPGGVQYPFRPTAWFFRRLHADGSMFQMSLLEELVGHPNKASQSPIPPSRVILRPCLAFLMVPMTTTNKKLTGVLSAVVCNPRNFRRSGPQEALQWLLK